MNYLKKTGGLQEWCAHVAKKAEGCCAGVCVHVCVYVFASVCSRD